MKKNTSIIIGMAIGVSVGCAMSIFSSILALPICMSMGISVGLIFAAKGNNKKIRYSKEIGGFEYLRHSFHPFMNVIHCL